MRNLHDVIESFPPRADEVDVGRSGGTALEPASARPLQVFDLNVPRLSSDLHIVFV